MKKCFRKITAMVLAIASSLGFSNSAVSALAPAPFEIRIESVEVNQGTKEAEVGIDCINGPKLTSLNVRLISDDLPAGWRLKRYIATRGGIPVDPATDITQNTNLMLMSPINSYGGGESFRLVTLVFDTSKLLPGDYSLKLNFALSNITFDDIYDENPALSDITITPGKITVKASGAANEQQPELSSSLPPIPKPSAVSSTPSSSQTAPGTKPPAAESQNTVVNSLPEIQINGKTTITAQTAKLAIDRAVKKAGGNASSVTVNFANMKLFTKKAADIIINSRKTNPKISKSIVFDSKTSSGKIDVRVTLDVTKVKSDTKIFASTYGQNAKEALIRLKKSFSNKIAVIQFENTGKFNQTAKVAFKPAVTIKAQNVRIYSFDAKAGKLKGIKTSVRFDKNGYLHFNTAVGGQLVISDGALKKK
ncbi:MAG: hypothetical protein LBR74_07930 [Eubacterium sp.]|nr:hypothetical protein [Eubacterium sp.]